MSRDAILDELALYLRPPGQGVHAVSTGREALIAATREYMGAGWNPDLPWRNQLATALHTGTTGPALLALPSDTGAGIVRGANRGPEAIRKQLGRAPVTDLGDVFTVPQLLDDEMHSDAQRFRTQDAIYSALAVDVRRALPVAPLSIAARVYRLVAALAPDLRICLLGGDHTVTWPALSVLLSDDPERNSDIGVVHFDAHTDLLEERLGIRYCFATWAYHVNERLGRGQRLIQLGIRASARPREHWESALGVRQIWADEARRMVPERLGERVVEHLSGRGVRRVYVTNDIDGTDAYYAAACGTPEPGGLDPEAVVAVIAALRDADFQVIGTDVVELAPGLSLDAAAAQRSSETAARYVRAQLELLQRP